MLSRPLNAEEILDWKKAGIAEQVIRAALSAKSAIDCPTGFGVNEGERLGFGVFPAPNFGSLRHLCLRGGHGRRGFERRLDRNAEIQQRNEPTCGF